MDCPECKSSLYSQTFDAWVCSSCGYSEPREDLYAVGTHILTRGYDGEFSVHIPRVERAVGCLKRFLEIRRRDEVAALSYLEFMMFSERDNLNRHYLAAQLAIKLLNQQSAEKHLKICLAALVEAKRPEMIQELSALYMQTFSEADLASSARA